MSLSGAIGIAWPRLDSQHVLHAGYKGTVGLRRDDPVLAAMGLESAFLGVRPIVLSLARSTMPSSTTSDKARVRDRLSAAALSAFLLWRRSAPANQRRRDPTQRVRAHRSHNAAPFLQLGTDGAEVGLQLLMGPRQRDGQPATSTVLGRDELVLPLRSRYSIARCLRDAAGWGTIMWILDFCVKHSSECVQMAEECTDAERRRAWLALAKDWVQLADEIGFKRGDHGGATASANLTAGGL